MKLLFKLLAVSCLAVGLTDCSSNAPTATTNQPNGAATGGAKETFAALPGSALKAAISVGKPPATLKAGAPATINVTVKNVSDTAWPAGGQSDNKYRVQLGNHWLAANNKLLMVDDGRTPLPSKLEPGKEMELPLTITAPKTSGDYVLEIDMVQEQVGWFKEKGSAPFRTQIKVE